MTASVPRSVQCMPGIETGLLEVQVVRAVAVPTHDRRLWNFCGQASQLFQEHECQNHFQHAGYRYTLTEMRSDAIDVECRALRTFETLAIENIIPGPYQPNDFHEPEIKPVARSIRENAQLHQIRIC